MHPRLDTKLAMPCTSHLPSAAWQLRGPPESPCGWMRPPRGQMPPALPPPRLLSWATSRGGGHTAIAEGAAEMVACRAQSPSFDASHSHCSPLGRLRQHTPWFLGWRGPPTSLAGCSVRGPPLEALPAAVWRGGGRWLQRKAVLWEAWVWAWHQGTPPPLQGSHSDEGEGLSWFGDQSLENQDANIMRLMPGRGVYL